MKIKHVITTLALAGLMGAGAFAGLSVGRAVEAKAANGDPADYYLVGHGSFATSDWSTAGGVHMVQHDSDKGAAYKQLLTAGDVFKGRHATNEWWYSYSAIKNGGSFFQEATNNMVATPTNAAWGDNQQGYSQTNYASANAGSGDIRLDGKHDMYIKAAPWWYTNGFSYGGIHLWGTNIDDVKDQNDKWMSGTKIDEVIEKVGQTDTTFYIYKIENVPTKNVSGWEIYRNNGTSNDAKSSNQSFTGNGNILVKTTGYYDIYLNSESEFHIFDTVQQWINGYMHMEDYDKGGTIGSTGGDGSCTTYYYDAKTALLALGNDVVTHFSSNAGEKYTDALARYNEWARINQDASPFANSGSGSRNIANNNSGSTYYVPAIVIVSSIAVVSILGAALMIKRRKEDR